MTTHFEKIFVDVNDHLTISVGEIAAFGDRVTGDGVMLHLTTGHEVYLPGVTAGLLREKIKTAFMEVAKRFADTATIQHFTNNPQDPPPSPW